MSEQLRVQRAIADGVLRAPSTAAPSFVDLATAVLRFAGVPLPSSSHSSQIEAVFGAPRHLVFVLVDGMGSYMVNQLPAAGAVRSGQCMELDAVFPATTACAMTTLANGTWPGTHGVPGWFGYLPERDLATVVLKFEERFRSRPLSELGVTPETLWPLPPAMASATRDVQVMLPASIAHSPYTDYQTGGRRSIGYDNLTQLSVLLIERLGVSGPAFTYCYVPEFDALAHEHGALAEVPLQAVRAIDTLLSQLADSLPDDTRLAISADHGLLDVADKDIYLVDRESPLMALLRTAPCGEPRTPHLFVRPGALSDVRAFLIDSHSEDFAFLTQSEADEIELFGPQPLSGFARTRFGDLIGVALRAATFELAEPLSDDHSQHRGRHGGMTPAEVRVPLSIH